MRSRTPRSVARHLCSAAASSLCLMLVAGCARTTILSSSNPSRDPPQAWRDYDVLPVEIHGNVTGRSQDQLAALFPAPQGTPGTRHIVMYVNPNRLPPKASLCSLPGSFVAGMQQGGAASVTGALCDGDREVTRASGTVLTANQSAEWLRKGFGQIREQLYQSLYPGTNDPFKSLQT